MAAENRWLNGSEAAEILGVSMGALRAWRIAGEGPEWYLIGRQAKYRRQDLDAYVAASQRGGVQVQAKEGGDK